MFGFCPAAAPATERSGLGTKTATSSAGGWTGGAGAEIADGGTTSGTTAALGTVTGVGVGTAAGTAEGGIATGRKTATFEAICLRSWSSYVAFFLGSSKQTRAVESSLSTCCERAEYFPP